MDRVPSPLFFVVDVESRRSHMLEQSVIWREVCNDFEFITFVWEKTELKEPVLWSIREPENLTIFTLEKVRVHMIPGKVRVIELHWRFMESTEHLLVCWVALGTNDYLTPVVML